MGDALAALEEIYFSFQSSLNDMLAACQDDAERRQVMNQYVAARQNYWRCINRTFHEDDPSLKALVSQAKAVASDLTGIDDDLGEISKVINVMTQAVTIGSQIAAKVITL